MLFDLVLRDALFVEFDAEAGLIRQDDVAVSVDADGLGEDEVADFGGPVRWVIGKFDERCVRDGGGKVEVGLRGALREARRQWGHLPPRDRDEILQAADEDIHDKYREQIERYYELLADPNYDQ